MPNYRQNIAFESNLQSLLAHAWHLGLQNIIILCLEDVHVRRDISAFGLSGGHLVVVTLYYCVHKSAFSLLGFDLNLLRFRSLRLGQRDGQDAILIRGLHFVCVHLRRQR